MTNVKLRLGPVGGAVEVDGHDISAAARTVRVTAGADQATSVSVDLAVEVAEVDGQARVTVPAPVAEALVVLGWTPPDQDEEDR